MRGGEGEIKREETIVAVTATGAGEPIKRMWEIASLLEDNDVPVRLLRSANPGKILYQDSYQIVVAEWKKL